MTASTQTSEAKVPLRCLVIQLARLGDTLQSLMALRAAKQLYPQLEIHFLARENFSSAAKKVTWIKQVITLPTEQLLTPIIRGEKHETAVIGDLARWIGPLVKEPWDMIVNWSFSEASSYLTGLIPARIKLGYTRRKDSSFSIADGWSYYIQGVVQSDTTQNIHLTDILTTQLLTALQIHAGEPTSDGNAPVTSKGFFSLSLSAKEVLARFADHEKKWIAIQLGAGKDSKTWPTKNWAKLIEYILTRHPEAGIFLLGGKEDLGKANSVFAELSPQIGHPKNVISLVGQTDFDLWAYVVSRSQWLFSGDTAAIHLASVLGTRIINLSIGPVRHSETGPYGNNHYVITSAVPCAGCVNANDSSLNHTCKMDLTPEAVYATWSFAAHEWIYQRPFTLENQFSSLGWEQHLSSIQVYRTRIRNSQDGGGVVYDPVLKRPLDLKLWSAMAMGHVARSWYCGWIPPIGHELSRDTIHPSLVKKLRELNDSTEVLAKICEQASQTATQLNQKSVHLKSEKVMGIRDREQLRTLGKSLIELEGLIDRVAKAQPPLLAFSQMAKVLMHNLKGVHLSELGKETAASYRQLAEGIQVYRNWIKFTLELAKPVAVKPAVVSSIEEIKT